MRPVWLLTVLADSKNLHLLEDWQPLPGSKGSTKYLDLLQDFQLRVLHSSRRIAARAPSDSRSTPRDQDGVLPSSSRTRIREDFVDTLCFLFDGILNGAMATPEVDNRRPSRVSSSRIMTVRDIVSPSCRMTKVMG